MNNEDHCPRSGMPIPPQAQRPRGRFLSGCILSAFLLSVPATSLFGAEEVEKSSRNNNDGAPTQSAVESKGQRGLQARKVASLGFRKPSGGGDPAVVTFSADGRHVFLTTPFLSSTVGIWSVEKQKQVGTLYGDEQSDIRALAVSANGRFVASGARRGGVLVWDLSDKDRAARAVRWPSGKPYLGPCHLLAFSPDGKQLAGLVDVGKLFVWRIPQLNLVSPKDTGDSRLEGRISWERGEIRWDNTGEHVFYPFGPMVRSQKINTGEITAPLGARFTCSASSYCKSTGLIATSAGNLVSVHGTGGILAASQREKPMVKRHRPPLSFSPDGAYLAIDADHNRIDVVESWSLQTILSIADRCYRLAWSPDSQRIVVAHDDGTASVWGIDGRCRAGAAEGQEELTTVWSDLASSDARVGYAAMQSLVSKPALMQRLLARYIRHREVDEETRRLVDQLSSDKFNERERATHELMRFAYQVRPYLLKEIVNTTDTEVRARLKSICDACDPNTSHFPRSPTARRLERLIQALERIGTDEAQQALKAMADPTQPLWNTERLQQSLSRMKQRQQLLQRAQD